MVHTIQGVTFERQPGGSVRVLSAASGSDVTFTPGEWAAIAAAVCKAGAANYAYERAIDYHQGESPCEVCPLKRPDQEALAAVLMG